MVILYARPVVLFCLENGLPAHCSHPSQLIFYPDQPVVRQLCVLLQRLELCVFCTNQIQKDEHVHALQVVPRKVVVTGIEKKRA